MVLLIKNMLFCSCRKFDIGIYTVISSIDPLRVYTYEEEALIRSELQCRPSHNRFYIDDHFLQKPFLPIRFCSKEYHPFVASDTDKYVVSDDYTPAAEVGVACGPSH